MKEIIGYRYIDTIYSTKPEVGDKLGNSYHWEEDEITDIDLGGTCAFETRAAVERYAKYSKGYIVSISGDVVAYGDLGGEIIVSDATVESVDTWRLDA